MIANDKRDLLFDPVVNYPWGGGEMVRLFVLLVLVSGCAVKKKKLHPDVVQEKRLMDCIRQAAQDQVPLFKTVEDMTIVTDYFYNGLVVGYMRGCVSTLNRMVER